MVFEIIGYIANICVMLRACPQIVKMFYYKSGTDVSYLTNIFIIFYSTFWFAYGILDHEIIILLMSIILILTSAIVITLKYIYKNKNIKIEKIKEYLDIKNKNILN